MRLSAERFLEPRHAFKARAGPHVIHLIPVCAAPGHELGMQQVIGVVLEKLLQRGAMPVNYGAAPGKGYDARRDPAFDFGKGENDMPDRPAAKSFINSSFE